MSQNKIACFRAQPCSDEVNYLQKKVLPHRKVQDHNAERNAMAQKKKISVAGHGHEAMASKSCASTCMTKKRSFAAAHPSSCGPNIRNMLTQHYKIMPLAAIPV